MFRALGDAELVQKDHEGSAEEDKPKSLPKAEHQEMHAVHRLFGITSDKRQMEIKGQTRRVAKKAGPEL